MCCLRDDGYHDCVYNYWSYEGIVMFRVAGLVLLKVNTGEVRSP